MIIEGKRVSFLNENNERVMYIDYPCDECVWCFESSDEIIISEDSELFGPLKTIMSSNYAFYDDSILKNSKSSNKLVWYSDCYYDPDNSWSRDNVSFLTIEFDGQVFKLRCKKPLDDTFYRKIQYHCIVFSPLGNGQYTRNVATGATLQDDFVINVYYKLLEYKNTKELSIE